MSRVLVVLAFLAVFAVPDVAEGAGIGRQRAIAIADRTEEVREELSQDPGLIKRLEPCLPFVTPTGGDCSQRPRLIVSYLSHGEKVAEVQLDRRTGSVLEAWNGIRAEWDAARGYDGAFGGKLNAWYVWLPLCLLFVAPFFDPRRPLRLLHLDLLMLAGLSVSFLFFNRGEIFTSVPLVYPVLVYLLIRLMIAGFRPRAAEGPLVPRAPATWLFAGLLFLVTFRIALNLADSRVIDVGQQSVLGASRLAAGGDIYSVDSGYGPVTYLAYLPFEQLFSAPDVDGGIDYPAAHAAAIVFDLLTIVGLLVLGRRLRVGGEGRMLGLALAYAWAACPFTSFVLLTNANDGLIAMLIVFALVAASSPAGRGALLALASAAKFVPAALGPLLAAGSGERRLREIALFAIAFAAMLAVSVLPFLPEAGLSEGFDQTVGFQASRSSPFSIWGQDPSIEWLQTAVKIGAVVLAVLVAFVPRRRSWPQVMALGGAVIIAVQIAGDHWFYTYVVWFLPLLLGALFVLPARVFAVAITPTPRTGASGPGSASLQR